MPNRLQDDLRTRAAGLKEEGLFKTERVIGSPQSAHIRLADGTSVLNLCANNYLGLADHPDIVDAAHRALDQSGYGMASVRFICGTQTVHKELEARLSAFLGTEETILYSSCFDANGGLFETILDEQDTVISDALNHASIIDGIRLCRAKRLRYDNNDMAQLEERLQESSDSRYRLIATDGVFSMDGVLANLSAICDFADRYDAMVMVDDSHAVGIVGRQGRGTHEYADVMGPSTSSPAHSAKPLAVRPVDTPLVAERSSTGCASDRAPTFSPTALRPSSPQRPCGCSICSRAAT